MSDNYSIKEFIEHFMKDFDKKLDTIHDTTKEIKVQTTKTNGRVNSLEKTRVQMWTAITILLLLGGTIITLAIVAIDSKIQKAIETALLDNVEKIEYAE